MIEATGNTARIVRLLRPFVHRVVIANPPQVRAIAHAKIKTDKIDSAVPQPPWLRPRGRSWVTIVDVPAHPQGRFGQCHVKSVQVRRPFPTTTRRPGNANEPGLNKPRAP